MTSESNHVSLHVALVDLVSSADAKVSRHEITQWLSADWPAADVEAHLDRIEKGGSDMPVTRESGVTYFGPYAVGGRWEAESRNTTD